ncbi:MAG: nickel-responsive transcriptional regulator NikR [Candidatus Micrarchaeia archaeon]
MKENNKYVKRISLSLPSELAEEFDKFTRKRNYWNRSKAVADALREWISNAEWAEGREVKVSTVSVVYNHEMRGVIERITEIQHKFGSNIIASMHIHLSRDDCLEVITVKGNANRIQKIANSLSSIRGVKRCKLTVIQ